MKFIDTGFNVYSLNSLIIRKSPVDSLLSKYYIKSSNRPIALVLNTTEIEAKDKADAIEKCKKNQLEKIESILKERKNISYVHIFKKDDGHFYIHYDEIGCFPKLVDMPIYSKSNNCEYTNQILDILFKNGFSKIEFDFLSGLNSSQKIGRCFVKEEVIKELTIYNEFSDKYMTFMYRGVLTPFSAKNNLEMRQLIYKNNKNDINLEKIELLAKIKKQYLKEISEVKEKYKQYDLFEELEALTDEEKLLLEVTMND